MLNLMYDYYENIQEKERLEELGQVREEKRVQDDVELISDPDYVPNSDNV